MCPVCWGFAGRSVGYGIGGRIHAFRNRYLLSLELASGWAAGSNMVLIDKEGDCLLIGLLALIPLKTGEPSFDRCKTRRSQDLTVVRSDKEHCLVGICLLLPAPLQPPQSPASPMKIIRDEAQHISKAKSCGWLVLHDFQILDELNLFPNPQWPFFLYFVEVWRVNFE